MNQTLTQFTEEYGVSTGDGANTSRSATSDNQEFEPWPDELPEKLQKDHYPPIHSNEPIVGEGLGSNVRPGDVDCYRIKQDDGSELFMGFLLLDTRYSGVVVYVLHNECYSEFDLKNYTDPEYADFDQDGALEQPQRKIYRNAI